MVMLSILFTCLTLAFIALAILYFRSRLQLMQFKTAIAGDHAELKKLREHEKNLHTELSSLQNKFQLATEDPITNLLGWPLFEDRLNHAIKESARYQFTMGLLFIDIDDFKMISDAFEHEVGNTLLREIAVRLQSCIRQVDSITRFGKNTFAVLLTQLGKPETAAIVAQRMLQTLSEAIKIKEQEFFITVAIGIAIYPTDGKDNATLFRNADDALMLAKQKGKHLYQFYQEKINLNSQRELTLMAGLHRESFYQELVIQYQPILNKETNHLLGMNALLTWQHPELGLIKTADLNLLADKQRQTNNLAEWLIQQACQQFLAWRGAEKDIPLLSITINFKQLENSQFIYKLSQILQELKFSPEWLLLRISYSPITIEAQEKALNMLHYLGVKIALDDFGNETFSLQHLKNLTPDYLLLSASSILDIHTNKQTQELIKAIIYLSKHMSSQLIAQGVDSEEQMNALLEIGCIYMQGKVVDAVMLANT